MKQTIAEKVKVPADLQYEVVGNVVKIGEQERRFAHPRVKLQRKDDEISIMANGATKREKKMLYTFKAHIQNMIKGETKGFEVCLKICSSHFPMMVSVEGNSVVIKNYLGEKVPRRAKVIAGTEVKVEGAMVTVKGKDIEKVGQTAANIEKATKRTGFDRRRFQDGIYIVKRAKR